MTRISRIALLLLSISLLQACVMYDNKRGVEVNWDANALSQLSEGKSTRKDVLELLGPPSQIISLHDESAFYYLFSDSAAKGFVTMFYNRVDIETTYDRAVFFFDSNDVLTTFSTYIRNDS